MIRVIRICNTCNSEYEQDTNNTPARIGNVVVYPIDFECSDCILKREQETSRSLAAMQLGMDLERARREMD